jgi:hypothetical protein
MPGSSDPMHDASHCPHIDLGDHRCRHRFTLANAAEAYSVCCGGHHGCAVFHRLNMEKSHGVQPRSASQRRGSFVTTRLTVSASHAGALSIRNLGA